MVHYQGVPIYYPLGHNRIDSAIAKLAIDANNPNYHTTDSLYGNKGLEKGVECDSYHAHQCNKRSWLR